MGKQKNMKGRLAMNKTVGIILGIFAFIILAGVISFGTMWSHRNTAVSLEEKIKAQHVSNKSEYDKMWKEFTEAAQVTDKQAEHFKDVYNGMIEGRYKDDNLLMKAVQEQNPAMKTEVYTNLQNLIVAGRDKFSNSQTKIADMIREYNTYIRKHVVMNTLFRFKVLDANDYIVTSERTKKAFEKGEDDAIDLNSKK